MSDSIAGIDFSQYQHWQQLQGSNGQTYYVVPGSGYVYDPFLSSAKGRPVLFQNNYADWQKAQAEDAKAKSDAEKLQQAQIDASSPVGQLIPIAGTVGGLLAAKKIGDSFFTAGAATVPSLGNAAAFGNSAADGLASVPSLSIPSFGTAAGEVGSVASDAAPAALGSGLISGNVLGTGLGFGPLGAIAAGVGLGAKGLYDEFQGKTPNLASRAVLDIATGGLNEIGLHFLNHKSTKQVEKERWNGLKDDGVTDADAAFAANHPEGDTGVWQTGPNAGKQWNFEDAQAQAKQDPSQFRLVLGNYKTFGNDWSSYTPEQQDAIVSGLIDKGLYKSDHGDIIITDEDAARAVKDQVLGVTPTTAVDPQTATKTQGTTTKETPVILGSAAVGGTPTYTPVPRSSTLSPGIGLDGKRISYS